MLKVKVAVYVPSTVNGNTPADPALIAQWVTESKKRLANLFGGFTSFKAEGGWYSPEHGLIEESVTIVQAFTDDEGLTKVPDVRALASEIAYAMTQEAVSVEVAGTLEFVKMLSA